MSSAFGRPNCTPAPQGTRRSRALAVRTCRVVLLSGATLFALVGALTTPPQVVLVVAPAFGVFVGSVVAMVNPAFPKAPSARRAVVYSGTGVALVVPSVAGIGQFGAAGAVPVLALVVLGCIVLSVWIIEQPDAPAGEATSLDTEATSLDTEELQQFVQVLPTSMLLREWRSTGEHLQTGADLERRAQAVLVRNLLLEELSRRDPVGVGRWLSEGDEDSPEQYLRGDSDATT